MLTREEYMKRHKLTDEKLEAEGKELCQFDDGDPDCEGWEIRYIDKEESVDIALGCKCSISTSLYTEIK